MPRRSSRQTTHASSSAVPPEGRKTRGAVKTAATEEPEAEPPARSRSRRGGGGDTSPAPAKGREQSSSPAPPPARSRRGRAKAEPEEPAEKEPAESAPPAKTAKRTSSRARKTRVVQEPEPEEEEEEEEEDKDEDAEPDKEPEDEDDEEYEEKPKAKSKKKSPAKGKGRARGRPSKKASPPKKGKGRGKKKAKDEDEDEEEDEDWEAEMAKDLGENVEEEEEKEKEAPEEEPPVEETSRSGRTRRSSRGSPKKAPAPESPISARKSPRGASRKASEAIEAIAKSEEVEGTPEPEEGTPEATAKKDKEAAEESEEPFEEEQESKKEVKPEETAKEEKLEEEEKPVEKVEKSEQDDTSEMPEESKTEPVEKVEGKMDETIVEETNEQMESDVKDTTDGAGDISAESEPAADISAASTESEGKKRKREDEEVEDVVKKAKTEAPAAAEEDLPESESMETEPVAEQEKMEAAVEESKTEVEEQKMETEASIESETVESAMETKPVAQKSEPEPLPPEVEAEAISEPEEPTIETVQATRCGDNEGSIPPMYRSELETDTTKAADAAAGPVVEPVEAPIEAVQATRCGENEGSIPPSYRAELLSQEDSAKEVVAEKQADVATPSEAQNMQTESQTGATESSSTESKTQCGGTDLNDYVIVDMKDLPGADSSDVAESLPKHKEASTVNEQTSQSSSAAQDEDINQSVSTQSDQTTASQNGEPKSTVNDIQPVPVTNSNDTAVTQTTPNVDPLLSRRLAPNPAFTNFLQAHTGFTISTYNILADCHVKRADYSWVPSEYMDMTYRHKRLLQEVQYLNPDILCLQEVDPDYYTATLKPALDLLGYSSVYKKRADDFHHEGEATFYRTSRFSLIQHSGSLLKDLACKELEDSGVEDSLKPGITTFLESAAVVLITKFQCLRTQRTVTVGNIHVDYANFSNNSLQCVQIASAVKALVSSAGGPNTPHLIVGDFNCWPGSPGYQLAKEGYLNDQSMAALQEQSCIQMSDGQTAPLVNLWWKGFQHTSSTLKSAYDTVFGTEPVTCQWLEPVGQTTELQGSDPPTAVVLPLESAAKALDYVWFSSDTLDVANVFETPKEEVLKKPSGGVPSIHFPSDHVSLKAQLTFK